MIWNLKCHILRLNHTPGHCETACVCIISMLGYRQPRRRPRRVTAERKQEALRARRGRAVFFTSKSLGGDHSPFLQLQLVGQPTWKQVYTHTHTKKIENKIYLALQKEIGTVWQHAHPRMTCFDGYIPISTSIDVLRCDVLNNCGDWYDQKMFYFPIYTMYWW